MAERRMFAKAIIDSDAFLEMPLSTQSLYFHLGMRADDDGFVNNPKRITRLVGAADDDFKLLVAKRYVLVFESGVAAIKHWKIHNYIQVDRYKPTTYIEERAQLTLDAKKAYVEIEKQCVYPECIQIVSNVDTQDRIGKDSNMLAKNDKNKINNKQECARAREDRTGIYTKAKNSYFDKFQQFFEFHANDDWGIAGFEIVNTMAHAISDASANDLRYNQKAYDMQGLIDAFDKISTETFCKIVTRVKLHKDIKNRPIYILGCLLGESQGG